MENTTTPSKAQNRKSFFSLASFGKRMEFWIIGEMLRQGLDVYLPLVDDKGIDAIIRKPDGSFAEVQIKARSADIDASLAAGFAGIKCEQRKNYWFIFYSSLIGEKGTMWLMTAEEFRQHAIQNKSGKSAGTWSLWLSGVRKREAYAKQEYEKFICTSFERLLNNEENHHEQ